MDIALGTAAVTEAEKVFLDKLQKIQKAAPTDLGLYDVALSEAIASTNDSMDQTRQDAEKRSNQLSAEEEKEKQQSKEILRAEDSKGAPPPEESSQAKADDGKPKRKPPTLLRDGEKVGDTNK